jgi:hypothetical protein
MRPFAKLLVTLTLALLAPAAVYAQASITGVVRDSSGAVLPGVTVEAASAALIEKTRTVVTDGTGQYRIENLRPGSYDLTFTLGGFSTVKRQGIGLSGSFVASVNAELRVGAVEETLTVTGETPIVDVQSTTRQKVIDHAVIDTVPTGRLPQQLAVLIPGVSNTGSIGFNGMTAQDVGGAGGDQNVNLTAHGGRAVDQRITQNGLAVGPVFRPNTDMTYSPNLGATQELTIDISGASAETTEGGIRINLIPKEGGNTFHGTMYAGYANESMASSNFSEALKARGLATPNTIKKVAEVNPGFGGPIKDRLWFFASARIQAADNWVGGMFFDPNWNNPDVFTDANDVDRSRRVSNDAIWKLGEGRATWQVTAKNKISAGFTKEYQCKCPSFISATMSPGIDNRWGRPHHFVTLDWTSPLTSRVLLEGGMFQQSNHWGWFPFDGTNPNLIGFVEQSTNTGYKVRFQGFADHWQKDLRYRFAASYITGAHAAKFGFTNATGSADTFIYMGGANRQMIYRLNNGVPNQLTIFATPYHDLWKQDAEIGVFAQDKWTVHRLTINGGMRLDYIKTHFPGQTLGPAQFVPDRNIVIPETPALNWKDVTPRLGASYDVFGTGKTAVKVSLNKYVVGDKGGGATGATIADPVTNLVQSTARNWTDANRNFVPDCDLTNPVANGECQAMANPNFGKNVLSTRYDRATLDGWSVRPYNWELSLAAQHEILPRVSVDIGYFRRWYGNFTTIDNRALSPSDFDPFTITAPADSRLPNGGANVISGLYNVRPDKFTVPADNFVTFARGYGRQIEHWNGVDFTVNARLRDGLLMQGGFSSGRTSTDNCTIVEKLPELIATPTSATPASYCHVDTPFLTQIKGLTSYTIPKIELQVSGSFQSVPGPVVVGNYNAPSAVVAQTLGRVPSGGAANIQINLVQPSVMYGERMNQLDLRVGKLLRAGRTRSVVSLDLYNALNSNAVLTESNAYAIFRQPQVILLARFAKISMQFDF